MIGATTYVALRWLSPRIASFSEANADISILLQHSVNGEDFRIEDVDFAIRWCRMEGKTGPSRPLEMPMPLFPVCSPGLLQRYEVDCASGDLATADISAAGLAAMPLLCENRSLDLWQAWYGGSDRPLDNPRRIIDDANVRTQAAVDGQGWTMADALMQRELEAGDLVAPFAHQLTGYGYAIQASPARYVNRKALELRNWLVDQV